jgi:hypothetical protein
MIDQNLLHIVDVYLISINKLNILSILIMKILQFFCSSLLVLSMTSCANKTATVENSATTPATDTATASKSAPGRAAGLVALQGVVSSTKKAVEAGKLDAAKTEIAKFEAPWKTVEDGVKAKTPDVYKEIEAGVESIDTGITKKQPKEALLASLQKLSQSIDKAGK